MVGPLAAAVALVAAQFAQAGRGGLRLRVTDQGGSPLQSVVEIISSSNDYRATVDTDEGGTVDVAPLPFGTYGLAVRRDGFATFSGRFEIRSIVPIDYPVALTIAPIRSEVTVGAADTLIDPQQTAAVQRIDVDTVQRRTALPGRALPELVNTQPGWLLEANGVLHPRGSENQTQYAIDGLPLTDNRSPALGAEVEAADVRGVRAMTGGFPAEYGRKLGGVIEVVTLGTARSGLHGSVNTSLGSFSTLDGTAAAEYAWPRAVLGASVGAADTDRYHDPPVEENFTNHATTSHGTIRFERDFSRADRLGVIVRRGQANFLVPNELRQAEAGQRQDRASRETMGQLFYQRTFSTPVLAHIPGLGAPPSAPRAAAGWGWPGMTLVLRGSYDRAFQTPAFENLLLASSPAVETLGGDVVHLAVRPSLGHFYEAGLSTVLFGAGRLDASYFVRTMTNFADDDLLLNTGVSVPIAFDRATVRGAEAKFEVPRWHRLAASASYAWMRGVGRLPITGGLFLGEEAAALSSTATFPVSQDQRHTVRGQVNYQPAPVLWVGGSFGYGSGHPFEFDGDRAAAAAQYGSRIVDRVNFETGRVRAFVSLDLSGGVVLRRAERGAVQLQAGIANVTDRLSVINFSGLFSGTALAPPRSLTVRARGDY